jgi:hypothetical protein
MNPEKIDQENSQFFNEMIDKVEHGKSNIKEILGFDIEGAAVFIPRVPCAHISPTPRDCKSAADGVLSLFSLAPIYDTVIYPIDAGTNDGVLNENTFKAFNNISLEDFLVFVEKKRIVPYFSKRYQKFDKDFIGKFLELGLPRISSAPSLLNTSNECV